MRQWWGSARLRLRLRRVCWLRPPMGGACGRFRCWTAGTQLTTANATPALLTFEVQAKGTSSSTQTVTLTNTGGIALTPTAIAVSGDFSETDNCLNATVNAGAGCAIQVTFTPTQTGTRTGQLTISANVAGGQLTVELSGDGTDAGTVSVAPASLSFGAIEVGKTSAALQVTVENGGASAVPVSSVQVSGPFQLANNACGTSLAANSDCALAVTFAPTQTGSGYRRPDPCGGRRHTDGAIVWRRRVAAHGYSFSGFAGIFEHDHRGAFCRADGHVDQQRRRATDLDHRIGERTFSSVEQLRHPACGELKLLNRRGVCAFRGRNANWHTDRLRFVADADGGVDWHWIVGAGDRSQPRESHFFAAAGRCRQCASHAHAEQHGRRGDGQPGFSNVGPASRQLFDGRLDLRSDARQRKQLHGSGDLYSGGNGRECGHTDGLIRDTRGSGGRGGTQRDRYGRIRSERESGADGICGGGAWAAQRGADSHDHEYERRDRQRS